MKLPTSWPQAVALLGVMGFVFALVRFGPPNQDVKATTAAVVSALAFLYQRVKDDGAPPNDPTGPDAVATGAP